jgi:protein gp37
MAERSAIEWCDSTFNPWVGCTKVSPACDHCYAETRMSTRFGRVAWGAGQPRARTGAANWRKPVRWNKADFRECAACGWRGEPNSVGGFTHAKDCKGSLKPARRRVFCASLADVFDNEVPASWRADLFSLILSTPNLDWLLLTKRIGNARTMMESVTGGVGPMLAAHEAYPLPNVWLGATICGQAEADRDIPKLLATPAAVRFLSIEPMLGPIDLRWFLRPNVWENGIPVAGHDYGHGKMLDWVIAGGESGPHARPSHQDWFRSLRDQCAGAGVPFLFKQWGEWRPISEGKGDWYDSLYRSNCKAKVDESQGTIDEFYGRSCTVPTTVIHVDGSTHDNLAPGAYRQGATPMLTFKVGKKAAGRLLDGVEHNGFPVVAR